MSDPLNYGLTSTCNGTRWLICRCGGDACFCSRQGEAECFGCKDCEPADDDQAYDEDDFEVTPAMREAVLQGDSAGYYCGLCCVWTRIGIDGYPECWCS